MSDPLVVVDADVLGRHRTGDETYVLNLLRELPEPAAAAGLRIAAVTRHPELVPAGIEAIELAHLEPGAADGVVAAAAARAGRRRPRPHAVRAAAPLPVPRRRHDPRPLVRAGHRDDGPPRPAGLPPHRAALGAPRRPRADRVRALAPRPRRALRAARVVDRGDAERRRPGVPPGDGGARDYVLSVGAIQPRKNQLAALEAAQEVGLPLVVVGPEKDASTAAELRKRGATLRGYVEIEELAALYRGAACLVQASLYEGFGLPVLEAMASGTPVVTVRDEALLEVAGDAAVLVAEGGLADGIRYALEHRDELAAAGLERARAFSWRSAAERTVEVYVEALGR